MAGRKKAVRGSTKARSDDTLPSKRKLVRDNIPDIIKRSGGKPIIRIAEEEEFVYELKRKIVEEAEELKQSRHDNNELEEIIDIMEAVNAYLKHKKISVDKAEKMRKFKLRKRGGFEKKQVLLGVG